MGGAGAGEPGAGRDGAGRERARAMGGGSSSDAGRCALQQGLRDDMLHRSIDLVAIDRETAGGSARSSLSPLASLPLVSLPMGYEGTWRGIFSLTSTFLVIGQ
jgi:hypothetical protein